MARRIGLLLTTFLVLGLFAAYSTGAAQDPRREVRISQAKAIEALRPFAGNLDNATVTGPFDAVDHRYFEVDAKGLHANVDAYDGSLRTLMLLDGFPASDRVSVSADKALDAAAAFLSSHAIDTKGLDAKIELVDHGSMQEYVVTWERRINGALVPDSRSVSINPETGTAFSISRFARPYAPPPKAKIGRDDAIGRARDLFGAASARLASADLRVWFDAAGNQVLVWWVALADDAAGAVTVQVDALSGDAQIIARG